MFKQIPNFPGYEVDADGNVLSRKGKAARFLKQHPNPRYLYVDLRKDGQTVRRYVHHLVLETFRGPCPKGMEADHLDGKDRNNRLSNLMWSTHPDNYKRRRKHGTQTHKLTDETRKQLIEMYNSRPKSPAGRAARGSGYSYEALAVLFGISTGRVGQIIREAQQH